MTLPLTPSQTVGPYFGLALTPEGSSQLVAEDHPAAIVISGTLSDGAGQPVPEGMLEIWQANREGRYLHPEDTRDELALEDGFRGFGRCHTDDDGRYEFLTIKPGPVPAPGGGMQAPHINVAIFGTGLLKPVRTRIYFSDEQEANAVDPVLSSVDERDRSLLVARLEGRRAVLDIKLQGDSETPFFDV
jgi:protocatechuate 3,4-dioxygenase alpha subunit